MFHRSMYGAILGVMIAFSLAAPAQPVSFRYGGAAGDVNTYRFTVDGQATLNFGGATKEARIGGEIVCQQRIQAVSVHGELTVELSFRGGRSTTTLDNQTISVPVVLPTVVVRMDPLGSLLGTRFPDSTQQNASALDPAMRELILAQLQTLEFPARELAPGDTWTVSGGGSVDMITGSRRFIGMKEADGKQCAEFTTTMDVPTQHTVELLGNSAGVNATNHVESHTLFDIRAGRVRETRGTATVQQVMTVGGRKAVAKSTLHFQFVLLPNRADSRKHAAGEDNNETRGNNG